MTEWVEVLAKPSGLMALSALITSVLLCWRRTRGLGTRLILLPMLIFVIFGAGPVAAILLGNLEYEISPAAQPMRRDGRPIVVLAAYAVNDPQIPLSSRVNEAAAFRVLEALHLYNEFPQSTMIVSGEGVVPRLMADLLVAAGIPPERIQVDGASENTHQSAVRLRSNLAGAPFFLVTSAGHMPRATRVFRKLGLEPLAAPTHYFTNRNIFAVDIIPSPSYLVQSDLAAHEYLALLWYRYKGWI